MIQLSNLSKSFGDRVLLDSVSWQIDNRERVGLSGPNGAGKTTLLKMLAAYDKVMAIILPTLGPDRRATYSPFLPISKTSGVVLQVPMIRRDVAEPLREEPRHIHVECRRSREHLRVAGPPEPLVALRAIGGHADEVPLLSPHDVVIELIEHRIRRRERAGARHVGVHDDAGDIRQQAAALR